MSLTYLELVNLYIKACPVFYFHKKEPYMPCDFNDMLRISGVNINEFKTNYTNIKMITIPEEKKFDYPVGKQILCKTLGEYTVNGATWLDLMYVLTFTWNGTHESHAFDKEEACVRLYKNNNIWEIYSIHGSIHGDGMWWEGTRLDREDNRCVLYVANESHAIYGRDKTYKRILGFGNDVCSKDVRWMPTEFVIFGKDGINIYNNKNQLIDQNVSYFGYAGKIGNEDTGYQEWPGSITFIPIKFKTCDMHQNGIDILFSDTSIYSGNDKTVPTDIRYAIRTICGVIWLLFFGFIIYSSMIRNNISSNNLSSSIYKKFGLFGLYLLITSILFITGTYIGWEIFILSPVNDYKTWDWPIKLEATV